MLYFLDTEFTPNAAGDANDLITLALVREDGHFLYIATKYDSYKPNEWVQEHVMPHIYSGESPNPEVCYTKDELATTISSFLLGDPEGVLQVIADWPEDIVQISRALMPEPHLMAPIESISFVVARLDSWPNDIPHAVQHNAYWDAMALRKAYYDAMGDA